MLTDKMIIKISTGFVIAFISLRFVMHEAHELVHTIVGRIICGCWGLRDFNVWFLCEGCFERSRLAVLSTFAGPFFSFAMIWTGTALLQNGHNNRKKSLGFALIFANNPFARIFTAGMGKGDEISGLNRLLENQSLAWAMGLLMVLLLTIYPLYTAFKNIHNKYRIGYFTIFLLSGIILDLVVIFGLMNTLLRKGMLKDTWLLGSPVIVTVFSVLVITIFIAARKRIYKLY